MNTQYKRKTIWIGLATMVVVLTPTMAIISCNERGTVATTITSHQQPTTQQRLPKAKTAKEIKHENNEYLKTAKSFLENKIVSLSTKDKKPSEEIATDDNLLTNLFNLSGKEITDKFKNITISNLKLSPNDNSGLLGVSFQLTKGTENIIFNKQLQNYLDPNNYQDYLDRKFFDDIPKKLTPSNENNWWHKRPTFVFRTTFKRKDQTVGGWHDNFGGVAFIDESIPGIRKNSSGNIAKDDLLYVLGEAGVKKLPSELWKPDVKITKIRYDGYEPEGIGDNRKDKSKPPGINNGLPNGYVVLVMTLKKGNIKREVGAWIIGWPSYAD